MIEIPKWVKGLIKNNEGPKKAQITQQKIMGATRQVKWSTKNDGVPKTGQTGRQNDGNPKIV